MPPSGYLVRRAARERYLKVTATSCKIGNSGATVAGWRLGLTSLLIIQMFPQILAFVAIFLLLLGLGNVVPRSG